MVVVIIIALVIAVVCILFINGSTANRPDWYQREQDDEQMRAISRKTHAKTENLTSNEDIEEKGN